MPTVDETVVVKILADLVPAIHPTSVDELEPYLVGKHITDGVEVARVEAVDVGGQKRALGLGQDGNG
jgi:hypothetical protein